MSIRSQHTRLRDGKEFNQQKTPTRQILEHLQRNESATIKEIEQLLGITTTAVRQHLNGLLIAGQVERRRVNTGVGRPHHAYVITDEGRKLFACNCDDLALMLLEEIVSIEGKDQAAHLLSRVGDRLAEKYSQSVRSIQPFERIDEFAEVLNLDGVLADVLYPSEHNEDGDRVILKTYNCPDHELAQEHREICDMDQQMISQVVGSDVDLTECMMDGHTGCSFVIKK